MSGDCQQSRCGFWVFDRKGQLLARWGLGVDVSLSELSPQGVSTLYESLGRRCEWKHESERFRFDCFALPASELALCILERRLSEAQWRHGEIEKYLTIGRMASRLIHELNNSFEGIKNYLYVIRQSLAEEEHRRSFEVIEEELHRIADMTHQLFEVQRQGRERQPPNREPVRTTLERVLRLLSGQIRRGHYEICWAPFADGFATSVSRQLTQIFFNLLLNAMESMPDGGRIHLGAQKVEKGALVTLRDEGCGIVQDELQHIFKPYFTTKETGLGLGLSICCELAAQIDATLDLKSQSGEGTEACLFVPLDDPPGVVDAQLSQPAELHGSH